MHQQSQSHADGMEDAWIAADFQFTLKSKEDGLGCQQGMSSAGAAEIAALSFNKQRHAGSNLLPSDLFICGPPPEGAACSGEKTSPIN